MSTLFDSDYYRVYDDLITHTSQHETLDQPPPLTPTGVLLDAYERSGNLMENCERMLFTGVEGDVYNPSPPFGEGLIAARYESRDSEASQVGFFRHTHDADNEATWQYDSTASNLEQLREGRISQDPSVAYVQGQYVVTVVDVVFCGPDSDPTSESSYSSVIYAGEDLQQLELVTEGPRFMKGVRVVELADGRAGVFTRPQAAGESTKGGRGKIGFTTVDQLSDITADIITEAPLLDDLFGTDEWGGVNQATLLPGGRLAVLAHIARFVPHDTIKNFREYYPLFFVFDPESGEISDRQIIGKREALTGEYPSKRLDLYNVLYPAFLLLGENKTLVGVGVSDTEVATYKIDTPKAVREALEIAA